MYIVKEVQESTMASQRIIMSFVLFIFIVLIISDEVHTMSQKERKELKEKAVEMFNHAYNSYMNYAYPYDELMPLSCKGRNRGTEPSRGDIDDALGNFTLTLIDALDTLVVLGDLEEFERAVGNVIHDAKFDSDIVVSVFETNIRVLGGLLGAHCAASLLKRRRIGMLWYNDELLNMATDVGQRLLPAFNTSTGMPYPRVNLKYGLSKQTARTGHEKDTCTACAGTMILEFAALSRLSGDPIFEEKARKAMDFIWKQRHRSTDLVGTVINIHNGDWVRRESGVGAGIDSYYEYVLKAYILLGDDTYLDRFNKHYDAVMKYVSQGPLLVDVQMHKPQANSRHFMDSLLAFWPGLQVLKGDIRPAIETHEMLYQVMQRHNFLPEAFTTDFRVHWGQHPLRPEFVESTYFLYKATGDHHYLDVGKKVMENLEEHARVPCGFASIKDVTKGTHEDQMDSFVLAETFKYLFLLFAEKEDLLFDVDEFLFTTEAHLLPLSLSVVNTTEPGTSPIQVNSASYILSTSGEGTEDTAEEEFHNTCPNSQYLFPDDRNYADSLRKTLKDMVETVCPKPKRSLVQNRLRAIDFIAGNRDQLDALRRMGIRLVTMSDGRVQLLHTASEAATALDAEEGMLFMQEMIELSKNQQHEAQHEPLTIQVVLPEEVSHLRFTAGPAQFGMDLKKAAPMMGGVIVAEPFRGCGQLENAAYLHGQIVIMERGDCMFIDKARNIMQAGAIAGIVIDHNTGSSSKSSPLFAMSGDGKQDVRIPMLFLFYDDGVELLKTLENFPDMQIVMSYKPLKKAGETPESEDSKSSSSDTEGLPAGPETQAKCLASHKTAEAFQPKEENPSGENEWVQIKAGAPMSGTGEEPGRYKMNLGTDDVQMEVKVITRGNGKQVKQDIDDEVIKLTTAEDGTKHLSFKFDQMMQNSDLVGKPLLNQLYVELVRVLQERTNFAGLPNQGEYLLALARLLEAAYYNFDAVDEQARLMFQQLANELEIQDPKLVDSGEVTGVDDVDGEVIEDKSHFDIEKELDRDVDISHEKLKYVQNVSPNKQGELGAKIGEDGILYIPDEEVGKNIYDNVKSNTKPETSHSKRTDSDSDTEPSDKSSSPNYESHQQFSDQEEKANSESLKKKSNS